VLLSLSDLARIEAGEIDLAFRRWKRPMHKAGGSQRTRVGVLAFDAVDVVSVEAITDEEARRAGYADRVTLLGFLARKEGDVYRIELRVAGPDPRVALRKRSRLSDTDRAKIDAALARLEWARPYLATIAEQPGVLAADLAEQHGAEKRAFKQRVRRLKELGLTESLEVGYRLSPRGKAYLRDSPR
jgi:DNA-binding transcriptional ArsR family regulator